MTAANKHAILKELEQELASATVERDSLNRRIIALDKAVAGVRELISLNGDVPPVPQTTAIQAYTQIPPDAFANVGNLEAAIQFLSLVGKPQPNRAVVKALIQGGKTSTAKNFSDMVRTTLLRESDKPNGRLIWTGHEWALREWSSEK